MILFHAFLVEQHPEEKNNKRSAYSNKEIQFTWGIQAREHDGNDVTLGESGALSHKRPPSNEQPSNCKPVILIEIFFPCLTSPDHDVFNTNVSIGCLVALAVCCLNALRKVSGRKRSERLIV